MQKSLKTRWKNLSKSQRLGLFVVMSVMLVGGVYAIWVMNYEATSNVIVSSSSQLSFSDNFETTNFTTTNNSGEKIETITILNTDGDLDLLLILESSITDYDDNCDATGDLTYSMTYDGSVVTNGSVITVPSGTTDLNLTTSIVEFGCPLESEATIYLSL